MAVGDPLSVLSHGLFTTSGATCDYPVENDVRDGVDYAFATMTGNVVLPDDADVLLDVGYGADGTEFFGSLDCPQPPTPVPVVPGSSPFASIVAAIRGRLVLVLGLDPNWIVPVANDRYKVTVDEPFFLYLRFSGIKEPRDPALSFENAGAGRLGRPVARHMRVYVYTRSGEDSYGEDVVALLGNDVTQTVETPSVPPGQFAMEEKVLSALDDWTPLNGDLISPAPLTLGPLHVIDASEEPERAVEADAGLVRSCLDIEVVYLMPVTPAEPTP